MVGAMSEHTNNLRTARGRTKQSSWDYWECCRQAGKIFATKSIPNDNVIYIQFIFVSIGGYVIKTPGTNCPKKARNLAAHQVPALDPVHQFGLLEPTDKFDNACRYDDCFAPIS